MKTSFINSYGLQIFGYLLPQWLCCSQLLHLIEIADYSQSYTFWRKSPIIAFILFYTTIHVNQITRVLRVSPLLVTGRSSYSMYLWQQLATFPFPGAGLAFYACSMLATIIGSICSFYWLKSFFISTGARIIRPA